jgi:hypothetical protein
MPVSASLIVVNWLQHCSSIQPSSFEDGGRCALCNGGLHVRSNSHGSRRAFFYGCTSHYNRGETVCPHVRLWPMEEIDRELMATLCTDVLTPAVAEEVVSGARAAFEASGRPENLAGARKQLATVERELERLTAAVALTTDPLPALVERIRRAESARQQLVERLDLARQRVEPKWSDIEQRVRRALTQLARAIFWQHR